MTRALALAVMPLAALPVPAAAQDATGVATGAATGRLTLECQGVAARRDAHATAGRPAHKAGKSSATGAVAGDSGTTAPRDPAGGVPVRFVFEFDGDRGRVHYPAALTPVVHSGGDAGWWPIQRLDAGDDAFTGRIVLNLFNRPRFTIDRHTGGFDLSGGLDAAITGRCAKPSATPRLF